MLKVAILCIFLTFNKFSFTMHTLSHLSMRIQDLSSPCPEYFEYKTEHGNNLYGFLVVESVPENNMIQINMELSIGNSVQGFNGNIELLYSREKVVDDITHHRPIEYKVIFPYWKNIPPKVTKIYVNGHLVCQGPKIEINTVPVLTTINLQHTLTINSLPLSNDNSIPTKDRFDRPSTSERPQGNNFFEIKVPNNINFNPKPPDNPDSIYRGNPFLNPTNFNKKPIVSVTTIPALPGLNKNPFLTPILNDRNKPEIVVTTQKSTVLPTLTTIEITNDNKFSEICGRPVATNSLIVDGLDVPKGAYPWLSAIFRVQNTGLTYICSGSLISNRHVVTAAHCMQKDSRNVKPQDLLIILGKLNIAKWKPLPGEKMIEPESLHVHPNYASSNSDADIAVITLSEILTFSALIMPVCLWRGPDNLNLVVGSDGVVAGWGKNEEGLISTAEPKQTFLPIVDQETCLRSSHQFQYITSNRTFCAGSQNGKGPCNGDSGSGLIIKRDQVWMLRGIVSMSISDTHSRTCDLNHYVVFTDASKFHSWLYSFIIPSV
ncbi:unnamed protein product [Brassicogethes aeneus]|uniref:Peptidase S1 domain-containing protein n=1 Tax=Brassicogethes aeneus TaxID=1431903 RepID=A0A9P0AV84_BRAAE|nr:unnamed protein product [Brassicogethes aeneus]